jgi:hypothetical protein
MKTTQHQNYMRRVNKDPDRFWPYDEEDFLTADYLREDPRESEFSARESMEKERRGVHHGTEIGNPRPVHASQAFVSAAPLCESMKVVTEKRNERSKRSWYLSQDDPFGLDMKDISLPGVAAMPPAVPSDIQALDQKLDRLASAWTSSQNFVKARFESVLSQLDNHASSINLNHQKTSKLVNKYVDLKSFKEAMLYLLDGFNRKITNDIHALFERYTELAKHIDNASNECEGGMIELREYVTGGLEDLKENLFKNTVSIIAVKQDMSAHGIAVKESRGLNFAQDDRLNELERQLAINIERTNHIRSHLLETIRIVKPITEFREEILGRLGELEELAKCSGLDEDAGHVMVGLQDQMKEHSLKLDGLDQLRCDLFKLHRQVMHQEMFKQESVVLGLKALASKQQKMEEFKDLSERLQCR